MATRLYTICTPAQAYSLLTTGKHVPRSLLPADPDAALTLFCCDMAGPPMALRPGDDLGEGGVGVILDWSGEEEQLQGWDAGPSPDILFHEYRPNELNVEPTYVRSLVTAGTRINLRIRGLVFDTRSIQHHLLQKRIPAAILPPRWRSLSKKVTSVTEKLATLIPDIGMPLQLEGPTLALRLIHERYAQACLQRPDERERLFQAGTPANIKPQKLREPEHCPEVYDVARYLLREFGVPSALGSGERFGLISHTLLFKDAYALSSAALQGQGSHAAVGQVDVA